MEHGPFDSVSSSVFYLYVFASLAGPLALALFFNNRLRTKDPKFPGYLWGFFLGFSALFFAPDFFVQKFLSVTSDISDFGFLPSSGNDMIEAGYAFGFVLIGIGLIKRMRAGWIAEIAVNIINGLFFLFWPVLILAAINIFYTWKQWSYLSPFPAKKK